MSLKAGLVGLPNVGKSTLFNVLTKSSIPAENYPFCTIDPHHAITYVRDKRLEVLKELYNSKEIIYSTMEFVDIAGLVKGASAGDGLGNQFLSHIRQVDLIIHVLRCFDNSDVINTQASVDPIRDYEIIVMELALKDLESAQNRIAKLPLLQKKAAGKEKDLLDKELPLLQKFSEAINNNDIASARTIGLDPILKHLDFFMIKPFLIVANLADETVGDFSQNNYYQTLIKHFGENKVSVISAAFEKELALLSDSEKEEFLNMYGIKHSFVDGIISNAYKTLNLISFFTCGPKEIHSWCINKGITVKKASGEIHSDLEKGFISAQIISYDDMYLYKNEHNVKTAGKMSMVGADYIVNDGDIINVNFNV